MIAIKTSLEKLPDYCDNCHWYTCRPHPHKGWTELCELESHCMDDDQSREWIYDGNGRPEACPLREVEAKQRGTWIFDNRGIRTCSVCGQERATKKRDNFCPQCGSYNLGRREGRKTVDVSQGGM